MNKASASIYLAVCRTLEAIAANRGDDRGQSVLEYAGMLVIVAALIVGLMKLNLHDKVGDIITDSIDKVKKAKA